MRHKVVHDYLGVDDDIVWQVATEDLPKLVIVDEAMQREAAARLDAWMALPARAPSTSTVTPIRHGNRRRGRATG